MEDKIESLMGILRLLLIGARPKGGFYKKELLRRRAPQCAELIS